MEDNLKELLGIPTTLVLRDYTPKASPYEIETFMQTQTYKDYLGELKVRIEDLRDCLEVAESKLFHKTQGGIAFGRLVENIFEDLLANSKMEIDKPTSEE
jgi:hypothetical protein